MIKNYKQFNESLRDKLVGPTEDEVLYNLKDLTPIELLHKSCIIGFLKGVYLAIEKGVNLHVGNDYALGLSSYRGHTEIVELLLDRGADVHSCDDYPLRMASRYGHTDVVKLLLDRGADIHINGDEPLRKSELNGHTETSELLKKYMEKK